MSYNPNVLFQRGNYGLQTLVSERIQRWGEPTRPSEYITGHKSPLNKSGHNADSNGIAHAVDIFVGPGNLTAAQADILATAVIAEGIRGTKDGYPKRATNIIWNRRIAGDETGWQWAPYTGPSPHTDHLHISTIDIYYGAPLPEWFVAADYDSTIPWGVLTTTALSTDITPIQEDDMAVLSAITKEAMANLNGMVLSAVTTATKPILDRLTATQKSVAFQEKFSVKMLEKIAATVGTTITPADLEAIRQSVREELAAGVSVDVKVNAK